MQLATDEVTGSNPVPPTIRLAGLLAGSLMAFGQFVPQFHGKTASRMVP